MSSGIQQSLILLLLFERYHNASRASYTLCNAQIQGMSMVLKQENRCRYHNLVHSPQKRAVHTLA